MSEGPLHDFGSKWDMRFLALADHIATWSKDPSTKVGAVIVRRDRSVASVGYNGFPRRINDTPERLENREQKYGLVIHAEMNAILSLKEPVQPDFTLFLSPMLSCERCAVHVIQSGIRNVVAWRMDNPRWNADFAKTRYLFGEARVMLREYDRV